MAVRHFIELRAFELMLNANDDVVVKAATELKDGEREHFTFFVPREFGKHLQVGECITLTLTIPEGGK